MNLPPFAHPPDSKDPVTARARYIMIGGFLGAGKTTAVGRLAQRLSAQGLKVGLITNDQGSQLVDTTTLVAKGFATEEIPGGCFCCRFNSLLEAACRLTAESKPDVFIAEPVGSCTDLVATVTYPLRRIYGDRFSIAPLSVLVDPVRALRMFGLSTGGQFSEKVLYIYRKQLQEADYIVINKSDSLPPAQLEVLKQRLGQSFPDSYLLQVSARSGAGLDVWFDRITAEEQGVRPVMEVDYEIYAEGEALLGWLNATVEVSGTEPIDGNGLLRQLAASLQQRLREGGAEVAHLKMTLSPHDGLGDIGVINLVRNDFVPELSQELEDPFAAGQLIINLRAETNPDLLHRALIGALDDIKSRNSGWQTIVEHLEHFKPGKPVPTYRLSVPT